MGQKRTAADEYAKAIEAQEKYYHVMCDIGQLVKRTLWLAKKNDEFSAIPILEELDRKYNGVTKSN